MLVVDLQNLNAVIILYLEEHCFLSETPPDFGHKLTGFFQPTVVAGDADLQTLVDLHLAVGGIDPMANDGSFASESTEMILQLGHDGIHLVLRHAGAVVAASWNQCRELHQTTQT